MRNANDCEIDAGSATETWSSLQGRFRYSYLSRRVRLLASAHFWPLASDAQASKKSGCCASVYMGARAPEARCAALPHFDLATERADLTQAGQAGVVAAWHDEYEVGAQCGWIHREVLFEAIWHHRISERSAPHGKRRPRPEFQASASMVAVAEVGPRTVRYGRRCVSVSRWRLSRQSNRRVVPIALGCVFSEWAPLRTEE